VQWQVLIPIRGSTVGKSRLRHSGIGEREHSQLVRAIQYDALHALAHARAEAAADVDATELIAGIHVVSGAGLPALPAGIELLPDRGSGLNSALSAAAEDLRARYPHSALLAVVGDLPSLRPADVRAVLEQAGALDRSFVPDAGGQGTTMLAAAGGTALEPLFGADSAARHRASGAIELTAAPSARTDVDTISDLARCVELGVGPRTAAVLAGIQPFI
jgi:2-phospho-L-lactate guanylyltransferase